jgi:hypothetical protein
MEGVIAVFSLEIVTAVDGSVLGILPKCVYLRPCVVRGGSVSIHAVAELRADGSFLASSFFLAFSFPSLFFFLFGVSRRSSAPENYKVEINKCF